ncbi:ATP-binding protein [Armatimonas sp.]|uniref:ATP-binding protein n=1 Tax=Armatimonas sp. TaxID=1872638 RepID=UPI0037504C1B
MNIQVNGHLDIQAVDNIIQTFNKSSSKSKLTLDLRFVTGISIECISWLVIVLLSLKKEKVKISIIAPSDDNAVLYKLKMWRFFDVLKEEDIYNSIKKQIYVHPFVNKHWIISLKLLKSNKDVRSIINGVLDDLDFCFKNLNYTKNDIGHLSTVVSEACMNVLDHAGDDAIGVFAAELIRMEPKRLVISLADDGCGLRTSLSRSNANATDWDDETVIRQALTKGVSGVVDGDRGLGLPAVVTKLSQYRGALYIRSGQGSMRHRMTHEGTLEEVFSSEEVPVPGTLISVSLPPATN